MNFIKAVFESILSWFFKEQSEGYLNLYDVQPHPSMKGINLQDAPVVGVDNEILRERVKRLHPGNEYNQVKWLEAVYALRNKTRKGWAVDPLNTVRAKPSRLEFSM